MRSEISEFSYGFAITAELRDRFRPWVVDPPYFPTLRAEAQLGWDVRFGVPGAFLFLQFKVAEVLVRPNAAEWHYYSAPYFRFPLHRRSHSNQHNNLRALAVAEPLVCYVGPRFHRLQEFNANYVQETVLDESAWIPLLSLPPITDDLQHHMTYRTGTDVRFSSPESEPIGRTFDGEGWQTYVAQQLETRPVTVNRESLIALRDKLVGVLEKATADYRLILPERQEEPQRQALGLLKDVAYLCRTFLGAEFLLIRQSRQ